MRHTITVEFEACYAHRLQNHHGACRILHGHNARIIVELSSPLNEEGMVWDFEDVEATVKRLLVDQFDHRTILQIGDPLIAALDRRQNIITTALPPTAEVLAGLLFAAMEEARLPVSRVTWHETSRYSASVTA